MYISKIQLKNIRGFTDLTFDLDRGNKTYAGWTVFTGDNGSGKSTLLKAVAIGLLGTDRARSLQPSFRRWVRDRSEPDEATIQLEVTAVNADDAHKDLEKSSAEIVEPSVKLKVILLEGESDTLLYTRPQSVNQSLWSLDAHGWFSCGYGPFRRVLLRPAPNTQCSNLSGGQVLLLAKLNSGKKMPCVLSP